MMPKTTRSTTTTGSTRASGRTARSSTRSAAKASKSGTTRGGARAATTVNGAAARAAAPAKKSAGTAAATRGRPPKKVFINVLVRETTRANLSRLKLASELASQGEVIDQLVAEVMSSRRAKRAV